MRKYLVRGGVILFWIALIFCGLYWPKWKVLRYEESSISIFAWGDIFDPEMIAAFEKESGIKVHLNFYSSNEELLVKLKATKGVGFDLIVPTDYAVIKLAEEDLLKDLDKSKLSFLKDLNPHLLGHAYDPTNRFSIPFSWEIFALGVDAEYFQNRLLDPSWKLLFDRDQIDYKVAMTNDPIDAILFGSFYLYGQMSHLTPERLEEVEQLLQKQKEWVEVYADFRADYFLATRNCPVVVATSSYLWRSMRQFDFVAMVIPKEGSFFTIENICIPKESEKEKLVYRFMNFLYRPEVIAAHYNKFGFFPATLNAIHLMHIDEQGKALVQASAADFKRLHFIRPLASEQAMRDLWIELKAKY